MLQFVYTNNFLKKGWASDMFIISTLCNKVKVIVIIFSCASDFALKTISWINVILRILVLCDTTIDSITNVGHLDLYFMVQ